MAHNPLIDTIMKKAVKPYFEGKAQVVEGYVAAIDYARRECDLVYFEPGANVRRYRRGIAFPKDGDGVFHQSLKTGDRVEVGFRNASYQMPYIQHVYRESQTEEEMSIENGKTLPPSHFF